MHHYGHLSTCELGPRAPHPPRAPNLQTLDQACFLGNASQPASHDMIEQHMDLFLFCREPLLASLPSVTTTRTWRGSGSGSRAFGRSTSGASPTTFLPSLLWTWLASGLLSSTASDFCSSLSCQCLYLFFFFCAFLWLLSTPLGYLVMLAAGSCCCCCSSYCLVLAEGPPWTVMLACVIAAMCFPLGPPSHPPPDGRTSQLICFVLLCSCCCYRLL